MNYSSAEIQQGIYYNGLETVGNANQARSKKIKDAVIMMEYVKKMYDHAQQDIHFIDSQTDKTQNLEESLKKMQEFFSTNSALISKSEDLGQLVQTHQMISNQTALTYQAALKALDSYPNISNLENISEHVSNVSAQLEEHVTQLQKNIDQAMPTGSSAQHPTPSIDFSKMDLISAVVLMTSDSYDMATALSGLQARLSSLLNNTLSLLNSLQAIINKLNSFYSNAQTYIVKYGTNKSQPAPSTLSWGETYNGLSWDSILAGATGAAGGGVLVSGDNDLARMFNSGSANGQLIVTPDSISNAIKYVSQQMSGLTPNDANTPYGTFFAQHGLDPKDSSNTTFLIQAIGKTTEMLQGKLSAAANVVQLAQQTVSQITNIFAAIMNLWSGLINKL